MAEERAQGAPLERREPGVVPSREPVALHPHPGLTRADN